MKFNLSLPLTIAWNFILKKVKKDDVLIHEKKVFEHYDSLMSEIELYNYIESLAATQRYKFAQSSKCLSYIDASNMESNTYLSKKIELKHKDFLKSLNETQRFVSAHFYVYPEYQPNPDMHGVQFRMEAGRLDQADLIEALGKNLIELTNSTESKYKIYRKTVKESLLI